MAPLNSLAVNSAPVLSAASIPRVVPSATTWSILVSLLPATTMPSSVATPPVVESVVLSPIPILYALAKFVTVVEPSSTPVSFNCMLPSSTPTSAVTGSNSSFLTTPLSDINASILLSSLAP